MKPSIKPTSAASLRLLVFAAALLAGRAPAALVYSGVQDIPVPLNFDGVYLNIVTGLTSGTQPGTWTTAPWFNPFFGGVGLGNSDLLRPVVTGVDQVVNLNPGVPVNAGSNFVAAESVSSTHVGNMPGQFGLGVPTLVGVAFNTSSGGPVFYGWIRLVISNTGDGLVKDWAYDDATGTAIPAGFTGSTFVPEPTRILLLLLGFSALLWQRRRR